MATNATTDNFLRDQPWDQVHEQEGVLTRFLGRQPGAMLGASLHEILPRSPGFSLHMHYGAEEMFFVIAGTPTFRNGESERSLAPGDVVFCPEGRAGLHTFANKTDHPVRLLAMSAHRGYPDVVAYPDEGIAWVATRDPYTDVPPTGDEDTGIVARFELQ